MAILAVLVLSVVTPAMAGKPQAATCKVDVRAKPIDGGFGSYHLFIVHTDVKGIQTYYRGGPEYDSFIYWGDIVTEYGKYVRRTIDWYPKAKSVTVASGSDFCSLNTCLAQYADAIEASNTPYALLGPNSNSVVYTLLGDCGLPEEKPDVWAPGWGMYIGD
ncbi:MAG: hypothetical protein RQ758_05730 [Methanomicrobiaceae archaeon]|nr:hypothetical protein [Methanomicrobiaceae archaeon]